MSKNASEMTYQDAIQELSHLNGMFISSILGEPEIFLSSRFVRALELAREALGRPERQDTYMEDTEGEVFNITVKGQCMSCGTPCGPEDQYCSHCGRKFVKEVR